MKKMSLNNIRVKDVNQKVEIEGILTGVSKPKQKIIQISYKCHKCGAVFTAKETVKLVLEPIKCSCGNLKGFDEIASKRINEQRILLFGFKVYLRNEKLIEKSSKIKRKSKVRVTGTVRAKFKKKLPIGEFVILADEIKSID